MNLEAGTRDRFDVAHPNLCENFGPVILGDRQIVHVEGVFRPDVTTAHAVAAIDARMALDAILVNSIPGEIHRKLEELKSRIRDLIGALLQGFYLQEIKPVWMLGYLKRCRSLLIIAAQDVHFDRVRPGVAVEDCILRNDCDVCVHQRSAAQTRSLNHADFILLHEVIKA